MPLAYRSQGARPPTHKERPTVIITGGAGTLGRAMATRLIGDGYFAVLMDIPGSQMGDLGADDCRLVEIDLTHFDAIGPAIAAIAREFPHIRALINNAGVCPLTPLSELSVNEWRNVMDVNIGSTFFCCQAVLPLLTENGSILNISSVAAHSGSIVAGAHYVCSKAAMLGLTKYLARLGAETGIRVNAIAPGTIDTTMTQAWPHETVEIARQSIPMGRLLTPLDVVDAVAFLLSDGAAMITGAVLDVNGGMVMR